MKRFTKTLILSLLSVMLIISGALFVACGNDSDSYLPIYDEYVDMMEENGGEPMSYDDWRFVITGDASILKGDKTEKGLSAYQIYKKYHENYSGNEQDWTTALKNGSLAASYNANYNIIYTLATIPPVLASLESIKSGYPTYAYIERGKTYNGIDNVDNFYNLGFSTSNNASTGFTEADFDIVLNKIKELNVYGNEKFNIYVQDGTALYGVKLAANANLSVRQFKVVMIEDGTGAYAALDKMLTDFSSFRQKAVDARQDVSDILSSNNNEFAVYYDISKAFGLATMDNFEFLLQSKEQVETIVAKTNDQTLADIFGLNGQSDNDYVLNLRYASISELVAGLSETQKEDYLNLMYGNAYQGTYDALTRTVDVAGQTVPSKKLVFIGTRVKGYPAFVTGTSAFGVGALTENVPTYANLNDNYKADMIFGSEQDYNVLYNILFDDANFDAGLTEEVKNEIRKCVFNYYINYIATLKFVYAQYGSEYDIIMKGHPRETLDSYTEWAGSYAVSVNGTSYVYDKVMFNSIIAFHNSDSVGKRLGLMPYGTAAENLAYLGIDMSIGGLPSSTYTGYEKNIDVMFVLNLTDGDITSDANLEARYEAGNLIYHDSLGDEKITKYYNVGLIYKTLAETSTDLEVKAVYTDLYENWIKTVKGVSDASGYTVNDQGFIVELPA